MLGRLLAAGAALTVVITLMAVIGGMRSRALQSPGDMASSTLARTLARSAREHNDRVPLGWSVTKATSAHRALVVDVRAVAGHDPLTIATLIASPTQQASYDEILVYVHGGQPAAGGLMVQRVQWTPHGGFVMTTFPEH